MRIYEVFKSDLGTQKTGHVDLVGVESAKDNLENKNGKTLCTVLIILINRLNGLICRNIAKW